MLNATFNQGNTLHACFQGADTLDASLNATVYIPVVDVYEGPYVAIPKVDAQSFPTARKTMRDDFEVTGVPYYEVSNQSGLTVFIANDINNP